MTENKCGKLGFRHSLNIQQKKNKDLKASLIN